MATINTAALSGMSQAELIALVTAMAAQPARKLSFKVTDKGGLSVYGLGRFPTTLYRSQWERLLAPDTVTAINAFISVNAALLTVKD
jgi:hypothetical protein